MGAVLAMRPLVLLGLVLVLAGCQTGLQKLLAPSTVAPTPLPQALTAEIMAGPAMQARLPARGAEAILFRVAVNQDVETWLAADNISLSFRQGVLVASRGLGFDLMGADASGTLAALQGLGAPEYRHQMRFLTSDHRTTYLMAGCTMAVLGRETIAGRPAQRFEESCQAHRQAITNLFWRDDSGRIVRSRQWVSPEIGYLESWVRANPRHPAP